MTTVLTEAQKIILDETALDLKSIDKVLSILKVKHVDDADLYFESSSSESWYLEDSQVKSGSFSNDKGVGIRAVSGEKTGFAYCDHLDLLTLEKAAHAARSIALVKPTQADSLYIPSPIVPRYANFNPIIELTAQDKIKILERVDRAARQADSRVVQVMASLSASHEVIMILDLHGKMAADVRPLIHLSVSVVVEDSKHRRESARTGGGGRVSYKYFLEGQRAESYALEALRQALVNLEAQDAPAGTMPVVLGPGWPGVLLHEAVGHGLEGDFNRKGLSAFSGRLGQEVAAQGVTVVDDGTLMDRRGSLTVDDEGTPSQCTTLIENGVLVNYMQDKLNAKLMGMRPTGNCRRESYAHMPMPRMTNTYMLAGSMDPKEIIASVDRGIYAVNFGGGQVDITSGQFVFSASEAYLIENGRVTAPIKGATLIGNGPEVMKKISMIGNNLAMDPGVGVCGKDGQSVPVGVGQPTLKIDSLTVGGTK